MIFTQHFQRELRALVKESPLSDGELRKVPGAGEMYIVHDSALPEGMEVLMKIEIDGVGYVVFSKEQEGGSHT